MRPTRQIADPNRLLGSAEFFEQLDRLGDGVIHFTMRNTISFIKISDIAARRSCQGRVDKSCCRELWKSARRERKIMKQAYAEIVHQALKESGINFVAYLPDDQIHDAQKLVTQDPGIITVGATNESEAVSACAGAWLGGAKPALLIADSGFLVAT